MAGGDIRIIQRDVVKSGVGFGSALAIVISYTAHKSVLWAIIHGFFSWFYVIYFLLTR
jgi:ABC-type Fe3+-siderophore transport system permease subunit